MFGEHPLRQWMGRHGGRRRGRPGGFMGGFGRFAGAGFPAGRKLSSDDLHLLILALLEDEPSHGYKLIKALSERSGGFYSPSPGMIYPALTYLEEIGHAAAEADGNRKLYRITDEGKAHLDEYRGDVERMFHLLDAVARRMAHLRQALDGDDIVDDDGRAHDHGAFAELHAARHALRDALRHERRCSPEEARRIADILRRAAADISGGS